MPKTTNTTSSNPGNQIDVAVALALPDKQQVIALKVATGTSLVAAVQASGITRLFPDLDLNKAALGVFGKVSPDPTKQVANAGDRIEIYRPLLLDPKVARAQRAARNTNFKT